MTENSIKQAENYRYSGVFWSDYMCVFAVHITSITSVFQDFADFFSISLVFNMFFTLMLVEVKLMYRTF